MPSKKQANTKSDLHFEDAIERLEEIIEKMENEHAPFCAITIQYLTSIVSDFNIKKLQI